MLHDVVRVEKRIWIYADETGDNPPIEEWIHYETFWTVREAADYINATGRPNSYRFVEDRLDISTPDLERRNWVSVYG